ncbi:hypothetical protein HAZT_HAZT009406 [Hyalella azteca]|uniref:FAM20 C-terminal domain-containing protein n=1 Tax=Hyalella azteca TaxID=294128 RepID=A0A6A0GNE4_HYAAZ|nr:hypothetical protein HAZT_HAZT009406 [Hyalella azteca]
MAVRYQLHSNTPNSLSNSLNRSLSADPLTPVLWQPHLDAVDRRLALVLQAVRLCVEKADDPSTVVVDDFH